MSALLAAQGQSRSGASAATGRADALKDLFSQIDADGDHKLSKSEFETALGAGGTNTDAAGDVFSKLDKDGDGSVSLGELMSALKGGKGHHRHTAGGPGESGKSDPLMQALQGASSTSVTNSDGSVTTSLTYADGSKVTMTSAAGSSAATSSYNVRREDDPAPGQHDFGASEFIPVCQRLILKWTRDANRTGPPRPVTRPERAARSRS